MLLQILNSLLIDNSLLKIRFIYSYINFKSLSESQRCIAEFMVICRLIRTHYIHGKTYVQWIFYIYCYGEIISGVVFFIKYLWIIIITWVRYWKNFWVGITLLHNVNLFRKCFCKITIFLSLFNYVSTIS